MMMRTKNCMIVLGLAAFACAGAMTPAIAAPKSKPAAGRAAVSDDATRVRSDRRGYGNRSFGRAVNDSSRWMRDSPEATGGGSLGYNRSIYYN